MIEVERTIAAERRRQIDVLGYDIGHDDQWKGGELYLAASAYLANATGQMILDKNNLPKRWPWRAKYWKPKGVERDLIRSGALFLAERDRRIRMGEFGLTILDDVEKQVRRVEKLLDAYRMDNVFGLIDYHQRVCVTVRPPGHAIGISMIVYGVEPTHYDKTDLIIRFQQRGILLRREDIKVETMPSAYK